MAWVRTFNPLSAGGWQFRSVAPDGSWAAYSTDHQMKRSGHLVTVWLRQEYPEPQRNAGGEIYLSNVEKIQYDCANERARALLIIYYAENNIAGSEDQRSHRRQTGGLGSDRPGNPKRIHLSVGLRSARVRNTLKSRRNSLRASQFDGRGQQLRAVRAGADQNLDLARLEYRLKIHLEKAQFGACKDSVTVPDSPGNKLILPKPFSSSFGRETLATLSCVNRKTVSCASLAPRLLTST